MSSLFSRGEHGPFPLSSADAVVWTSLGFFAGILTFLLPLVYSPPLARWSVLFSNMCRGVKKLVSFLFRGALFDTALSFFSFVPSEASFLLTNLRERPDNRRSYSSLFSNVFLFLFLLDPCFQFFLVFPPSADALEVSLLRTWKSQ